MMNHHAGRYRRVHMPLHVQQAERLVTALRRPTVLGSWHGRTGTGEAVRAVSRLVCEAHVRQIRCGQWVGPWRFMRDVL